LVERGKPGDDGTQQRLEEAGGRELPGFTDDQTGFRCEQIEAGQAHPRAADELGP